MTINRITINGQQYDSPEAMPPDVRRTYDEAMRTVETSLASGRNGGSTQIFSGQTGHLGASVVVNKIITVNDRTYGNVDELPSDVRKLYDDALEGATSPASTTQPRTGLHVSVNWAGPQVRTLDDSNRPHLIESSTESRIRGLPMSLAFIVAIGLVLWFLLGR